MVIDWLIIRVRHSHISFAKHFSVIALRLSWPQLCDGVNFHLLFLFLFVHSFESIEIVPGIDFGSFLLRALSNVCQFFWPLPTCLEN